jgi:amino-acid N-acetyltransferase
MYSPAASIIFYEINLGSVSEQVELRAADQSDEEYIFGLLEENDLPTADLSEKRDCLYVCETESSRVGVAGLEEHDGVGLLRSMAIEESVRGKGYGTIVCEKLLAHAQSEGLSTVYLLTTTAEAFFDRLGFETISREGVPPSIRETSEFSDLCPTTAVSMKRDLEPPTGQQHD